MTSPDQSSQPHDVDADSEEVGSLGSEIRTTLRPSPQSSANKRNSKAPLSESSRGSGVTSKRLRPAGEHSRSKEKAVTSHSVSLSDGKPPDPQFGDNMAIEMFQSGRMAQPMQGGGPTAQSGNYALQDYQMQLMLLEQQNKKRLMMARQEQDNAVNCDGAPPVTLYEAQENPSKREITEEGIRPRTTPFRVPPSSTLSCFPCRKKDLETELSCNGLVPCNHCSTQGRSSECRDLIVKTCDACHAVKVKCGERIPCKACVKMDLGDICTPCIPKFMDTEQQPNTNVAEHAKGLDEAHADNMCAKHAYYIMQAERIQREEMSHESGSFDFNSGENFNLDFSTLDNPDVLEDFDFDSFLNTTSDDAFAFDSSTIGGDFGVDVDNDFPDSVPHSRTLADGWRSTVAAPQPKSDVVRPSPKAHQR